MSSIVVTSSPAMTPIAVRDSEADILILGERMSKARRSRLRELGHWPSCFYVGGHAYVLMADVKDYIQARVADAPAVREKLQQRSRVANARRWRTRRTGGQQ